MIYPEDFSVICSSVVNIHNHIIYVLQNYKKNPKTTNFKEERILFNLLETAHFTDSMRMVVTILRIYFKLMLLRK